LEETLLPMAIGPLDGLREYAAGFREFYFKPAMVWCRLGRIVLSASEISNLVVNLV
jgi:hypothetical protein